MIAPLEQTPRQTIAIIGSGVSGLVCGALLHRRAKITVFEADGHVGGHANTVDVAVGAESHAVDTGFVVYNERNYPNLSALFRDLGVRTRPTSMGFSMRCRQCGVEYNGSSLRGMFLRRRNLFRPSYYRMLRDIVRFNRDAPRRLTELEETETLGRFLRRERYGPEFAEHYLLPMGAAIWSCAADEFSDFPARFVVEFYRNHGLLSYNDRPQWRIVCGGSREYVGRLTAPFRGAIRLHSPVLQVRRDDLGVDVATARGVERFDEVIFACHSDQALRLLADPTPTEVDLLSAFRYGRNDAVLHADERLLPEHRGLWASWNYDRARHDASRPTLTYCMNILQGIESQHIFCVTLNDSGSIRPERVLGTYQYSHPVFSTRRDAAQRRHGEMLRNRRTSYCGAYWGNGFHEDGVNSALAVGRAFGIVPEWAPARQACDEGRPTAGELCVA
ncbi:MAG: FAD-dependent oxidoreductase [Planctomyces sp.]|nr:FAD-dependent oxidoreductase [Planctomyces sp.]